MANKTGKISVTLPGEYEQAFITIRKAMPHLTSNTSITKIAVHQLNLQAKQMLKNERENTTNNGPVSKHGYVLGKGTDSNKDLYTVEGDRL